MPEERIVLPAALGELLAGGRDRPLRPLLGDVHRPRPGVRRATTTAPATTPSATSSTGTSSSWRYELHEDGSLTDLPKQNIDTGLGLERMALIQQGVDSVFETDRFRPLVELAEELSRPRVRRRRQDDPRDADPRRPLARDGQPDRRRGRAVERGPRLRAAPDHAPRDPAGPRARARGALPGPLRRDARSSSPATSRRSSRPSATP